MLAVRQHDVGLVADYPFDPCVPEDTFVIPQPYPYEPEKCAWLKCEMQAMVAADVLEQSDDVKCAGGIALVEGQKEGTQYHFCTDFLELNAVLQQKVYPIPDIP